MGYGTFPHRSLLPFLSFPFGYFYGLIIYQVDNIYTACIKRYFDIQEKLHQYDDDD